MSQEPVYIQGIRNCIRAWDGPQVVEGIAVFFNDPRSRAGRVEDSPPAFGFPHFGGEKPFPSKFFYGSYSKIAEKTPATGSTGQVASGLANSVIP